MWAVLEIRRWKTQHPGAWVGLTQGAPILAVGFAAAIALARLL